MSDPVASEAAPDACRPLLDAARSGEVTLLYSARDRDHNSAVVLRDHLLARLRHSSVNSDRS